MNLIQVWVIHGEGTIDNMCIEKKRSSQKEDLPGLRKAGAIPPYNIYNTYMYIYGIRTV